MSGRGDWVQGRNWGLVVERKVMAAKKSWMRGSTSIGTGFLLGLAELVPQLLGQHAVELNVQPSLGRRIQGLIGWSLLRTRWHG